MPTFLLCLALYWMGNLPPKPNPTQTPDAIRISGICFDITTAAYLPVEAFTVVGTTKIALGGSDKEGKFFLQLPLAATSISFASKGYHTVTLPVNFINKPSLKADFRLGIIMSKQDSAVVLQTDQLLLSNDLPDDGAISYLVEPTGSNAHLPLVITAHGNRRPAGGQFRLKKGGVSPRINFEGARPGPYRIAASMDNGQVLVDKRFIVKEGLTFMEVRLDEPIASLPVNSVEEKSRTETAIPSTKIVYFDQSQYELKVDEKTSLDSVARILLSQPQLTARITGYTDNVGEQKRNLALSEYRAKSVANYLQQKGVNPSRLLTVWQGGKSLTEFDESEAIKSKKRRVVIEFESK